MIGWVGLAGYVVLFVLTYRKAYVAFMEEDGRQGAAPDTEARAFCTTMALAAALVWPITLVGWVFYRFLSPTTPREREADLRERERRVAQMERDLNIRDAS